MDESRVIEIDSAFEDRIFGDAEVSAYWRHGESECAAYRDRGIYDSENIWSKGMRSHGVTPLSL